MKGLLTALSAGLAAGLPVSPDQAPRTDEAPPALSLSNITRVNFPGISGRRLEGPFMGTNFPDPGIISGEGTWKAYSTSSDGKYVPIATSPDAFSWTLEDHDALPDPGYWVDPNDQSIWAPDVQKNDDGLYVMYYTAHKNGGNHCIGLATSPTAIGPFTHKGGPIICDDAGGGAIDASGYDDGVDRWILWKVDGNVLGGATTCQNGTPSGHHYKSTPIMIQRVARDAMTLLGSPRVIFDNDGRGNDGLVEAPSLYQISKRRFILFYSSHCFSSDEYDIEYAFSDTIDGTYSDRGVLLRTSDGRGGYGPGGLDIDPNGRTVVFHGRQGPNQGADGSREMYSAELSLHGDSVSY